MTDETTAQAHENGLKALTLGALGVVFGDIGTSPLYTIKTALDWSGGHLSAETALGMLSLIVWTLIVVTSVKYVAVIMRADNDGEGGILALMSLLGMKHGRHPAVIAIGMLGAGAVLAHPKVLAALDPRVGLAYLGSGGSSGFLILGAVFLCATGAEALYADMGHFELGGQVEV